jgi:hypothetical protein
MRAIRRHYIDKVNISTLSSSGASLVYTEVAINVPCNIQPVDGSYLQDSTGMYAKGFYIFMDYRDDVQEGTKLEDVATGNNLRVVSVEHFMIGGQKKHMEVVARAFDNNAQA